MIQSSVKRVVDAAIRNNVLVEKDRAIVEYGLLWAINSFGNLVGFAIIGYLMGFPGLILLGAVVGGIFRFVSGGAHFQRPLECFFFSAIILLLFGFMAQQGALIMSTLDPLLKAGLISVALAIGLFSALRIIDNYAPAANEKRPITNAEERQRLKLLSFVFGFLILIGFILATFIFCRIDYGIMLMLTFWFQLFSLTPVGYGVFETISKNVGKIRKRGR